MFGLYRKYIVGAVIFLAILAIFSPLLALAQSTVAPAIAPVAAVGLLATLVHFLPLFLSLASPYVTHILQGYTQKIPASWQPVLSAASGIVIAVLTGSATGSPISPDVLAIAGGITGGIGHGLLQSTPIASPVVAPKV